MSDWEVGDLAVCVDNAVRPRESMARLLEIGRVYRVKKCGVPENADVFCLAFEEIKTGPKTGAAFVAARFRKIRPDAHEACEDEFVTLLKKAKVSA